MILAVFYSYVFLFVQNVESNLQQLIIAHVSRMREELELESSIVRWKLHVT